jgi:hypothetical protein
LRFVGYLSKFGYTVMFHPYLTTFPREFLCSEREGKGEEWSVRMEEEDSLLELMRFSFLPFGLLGLIEDRSV